MNRRIFITGDTHGVINTYKLIYFPEHQDKLNLTKDDVLIVAGDFGVPWDGYDKDNIDLINFYEDLPVTVMFVDGNHEDFTELNKLPTTEKFGALCGIVSDHIFHINRGEVLDIDGKKILCVGGANSIDKAFRVAYESWWPDEEISHKDIEKAINAVKRQNPDIIVSHEAPLSIVKTLHGRYTLKDNSSSALEGLYQYIRNNDNNVTDWYFGHHHVDRELADDRINFHALFNDIVQVPN